ncbi:DUF624 domain-containing protein [Microbacterium sp. zg.Y625]|uniref:YesL family protein n=1 Tax=Microbacterium jiangjiandongii TaxID=3049071 RepID=UPI00214AE2E9|nr:MULTISPECIES: DUF624 domain-containing protein [unclassified Microbacterium]MCR2792240.1 DUF624 domain-containing protein [Microbacterium sp. zg.Y625]WIM25041.1 DUF624 domain-containing protein [Microbacterium sp. zg-Y625]
MTTTAAGPGWALRVHAACDWVMWAMALNALWIVFTLAGGVVLGAAPATVAAAHVTRRRLRGEAFPALRTFARAWRSEFFRSHLVLTPALTVTALLLIQVVPAVPAGTLGEPITMITAVAAVLAVVLTALLAPLYVHYDLPLRRYLPTASRWMLRNLAPSALLAVAAVAVTTASLMVPGLIPFVSVGAWLAISTALCLGFFAANDRLVAEQSAPAHSRPSPQPA